MAASKTFTLSTSAAGMPEGIVTEGPISDTAAAAIDVANSITLSSSFAQITVPATATYLMLYMASGNAINIIIAGANTDTGINMGSGWTWAKMGCLGGTATIWVKSASGSPVLYYRFN